MGKKFIASIEAKRPAEATLQKVLELRKNLTLAQIGTLWNITPQRVWALEQKAKRELENEQAKKS